MDVELELLPDAAWEIWYQDTFDRESPRSVDLAGRGLEKGLVELWARHLFETVQAGGRQGFARFNLWWVQEQRGIEIAGDWAGQTRLRGWVFGAKMSADQGYVGSGDDTLLRAIAHVHCRLVLAGRSGELILAAAAMSDRREDFKARLVDIVDLA